MRGDSEAKHEVARAEVVGAAHLEDRGVGCGERVLEVALREEGVELVEHHTSRLRRVDGAAPRGCSQILPELEDFPPAGGKGEGANNQ